MGGTQISKNHKIDLSKPVYLSEENIYNNDLIIQNKDLILVKTGNTIGKLALIDGDIGRATINPNTVILRPKCESRNLFIKKILFHRNILRRQISDWDFVAVGAQPSLNQQNIKSLKIPFPPKFERDKINKVLLAMDQVIEEKEKNKSNSVTKKIYQ